jgi:L-fucose/D-arabinose isomerase
MATISLLTFSDGRGSVATDIDEFRRRQEDTLRAALAAKAAAASPDLSVFPYPVRAFPHFTMLAATATTGRLLDVDVDDLEPTR